MKMLSTRTPEEFSKILDSIEKQANKRPPVEKWHPEKEVSVDISIDSDGQWYYQGRPMKRQASVKLFASIIRKEEEQYYLVTPVEKARLQVEDVPFVIVDWEQYLNKKQQPVIIVYSNVEHRVILSREYPLVLQPRVLNQKIQSVPYVDLGRGLRAKVKRSVFYQLIDHAQAVDIGQVTKMLIASDGETFELGTFDASTL